jgi:hypothetical protein
MHRETGREDWLIPHGRHIGPPAYEVFWIQFLFQTLMNQVAFRQKTSCGYDAPARDTPPMP